MKTFITFAAFVVFVVAAPAYAQNKVPSAEIAANGLTAEDFPRWQEIVPGVYAYEDLHSPDQFGNIVNTVSMIVVTPDGVVVADGQQTYEQTQALVENIKKLTPLPIKYVIIASDHIDHVGGNDAFKAAYPDLVFISTPFSQGRLAFTNFPPTETVTTERTLTLGETEIEILNIGRGHTGGDLVVYLPESKVLFMGELYLRGVFPAMRTGNPTEWINTIENAQKMDVSWYLPGHGFIEDAETMERDLQSAKEALEHVVGEAKRLHAAGVPCERAQLRAPPEATCEAADQADWSIYSELAMGESLGIFSILRVYHELDGRLP